MPVSPKDEEEVEATTEELEMVVMVQMALTEKEKHVEDGRFRLKNNLQFDGVIGDYTLQIPPNYHLSSISLH